MGTPLQETVYDLPQAQPGWWDRYSECLDYMSETGRNALDCDTSYIVEHGIFGSGEPNPKDWPVSRLRTGLVMGSVQSGKTASMFGVIAKCIDRQVDIVIVLAGTRRSLWHQTYDRLSEQLDNNPNETEKYANRLLVPTKGLLEGGPGGSLQDLYRLNSAKIRALFSKQKPLLIVAMKQTDHLYALGKALRESVFPAAESANRPVHMLVVDDEADDGSILDAAVESHLDPLSDALKQIPRAIADLWDPRSSTSPKNLLTTYLAYTATPQANLLQEDHNPLAPRDFVVTLRTPLDQGEPVDPSDIASHRTSTYPEPEGLNSFYTGGEVFYERGERAKLCAELSDNFDDDLASSLRAFLVAGAIRLYRTQQKSPTVLGPRALLDTDFESYAAAKKSSPEAHTMLYHPAAAVDTHFEGAEKILMWAGIKDQEEARTVIESGSAYLPDTLITKLETEETAWESWLHHYASSWKHLKHEFNSYEHRVFPTWEQTKALLTKEIIPGTRVAVINSDPAADDRPEFDPYKNPDSYSWRAAKDTCTIFVAGNVMARGLTLNGMTTALFCRSTNNPLADTQMQMQRWFGYRGEHIEFCRVFASKEQLQLFRDFHNVDEALREGIAAKMEGAAPAPIVLQKMGFLATGKIANIGNVPLCSKSNPFFTLVNSGMFPDPNARVIAELFSTAASSEVIVGETPRGRALDDSLSLLEAADLLSRLTYDDYKPGNEHPIAESWNQLQARVNEAGQLPVDSRFYDAPIPHNGDPNPVRIVCPYSLAAYLRLWNACLTRHVRGLFVTGSPTDNWYRTDLVGKQSTQPRFTVGIRYGSEPPVNDEILSALTFPIPATRREVKQDTGELANRWGGRNPGDSPDRYRGDEYFDYYHRGEAVPPLNPNSSWRPEGSHGQILFYVNQLPGQKYPAVAVAVSIPAGGPEQFSAVRSTTSVAT